MFKDDGTQVPFHVAKYRDQYREDLPEGPGYSLKMENSPELPLGPDEPKGELLWVFLEETAQTSHSLG